MADESRNRRYMDIELRDADALECLKESYKDPSRLQEPVFPVDNYVDVAGFAERLEGGDLRWGYDGKQRGERVRMSEENTSSFSHLARPCGDQTIDLAVAIDNTQERMRNVGGGLGTVLHGRVLRQELEATGWYFKGRK